MPNVIDPIESVRTPIVTAGERLVVEYLGQADIAPSTRIRQRTFLIEFLVWLNHPRSGRGEQTALTEVSRGNVARFMAYLRGGDRYAARPDSRRTELPSASTRKNYLAAIRSFYRYLVTVELVDTDPTIAVPRPKIKTTPGLRLTADELRRLLAAAGPPRCRVQVYLLAFTGARVGEIRGLRWRDVNFEDGTMRLHGKGDKWRVIFIHPRLMPELRRWKLKQDAVAQKDSRIAQARSKPDTDFVLLTSRGKQVPHNAIYKQLKRRATRAQLYVLEPAHREKRSEVSPHALRRTFATILLNGGEHLDAVADVLGHESVDTTRKHYAFASQARRKATIEAFNI